MHAEFIVEPNGHALFDRLPEIFGRRNKEALARSRVMKHLTNLDSARYYACEERPAYRLSAWWHTTGSMRLIVEPTGPIDMRRTCQEIWDELRTAAKDLKPRLASLTLDDDTATRPLAAANTGFLPSSRRAETFLALAAGVASLAWLIAAYFIFGWSADLVLGAVPAIAIAIGAGVYAAVDSRSGTLYWR